MEKIFFFLYSIFTFFLSLLLLPFLLLLSFKSKYKASIPARFFLWKNSRLQPDGIWFHSCSFGEAKAIAPLVKTLPKASIRLTTTTNTGFKALGAYSEEKAYLPFETLLFFWLRPQKILVVMEAEFWYLLFALAKKRGARTLLINARMSDKSYPKYQKMAFLYRHIFKHIDEVYAQTPLDKERLAFLGAKNIVVTGNIKLSHLPQPTKKLAKPKGLIVCGASTHEKEEALILEAFLALKKEREDAKLIVVPRHPQRFTRVSKLIEKFAKMHHFSYHKYSNSRSLEDDIILIDALGKLINIYAISDIVILGGAFEPIGGHNAGEVAQFGCKIISGKHYFNQRDIFNAIESIAIVEKSNLARRLCQYGLLKPTKIKYYSDISPIVESLRREV